MQKKEREKNMKTKRRKRERGREQKEERNGGENCRRVESLPCEMDKIFASELWVWKESQQERCVQEERVTKKEHVV